MHHFLPQIDIRAYLPKDGVDSQWPSIRAARTVSCICTALSGAGMTSESHRLVAAVAACVNSCVGCAGVQHSRDSGMQ